MAYMDIMKDQHKPTTVYCITIEWFPNDMLSIYTYQILGARVSVVTVKIDSLNGCGNIQGNKYNRPSQLKISVVT